MNNAFYDLNQLVNKNYTVVIGARGSGKQYYFRELIKRRNSELHKFYICRNLTHFIMNREK